MKKQYLCTECESLCVLLEDGLDDCDYNVESLMELSEDELQTVRLYNCDYRANNMEEYEEYKKKKRTDRQIQIEQLFIKHGSWITE